MEDNEMESGLNDDASHFVDFEDFKGHFGPGSAFILFGCLWAYNSLFRYHVARRQAALRGNGDGKLKYKNAFFSKYHAGWARAVPVEAFVLLIVTTTMSIGETVLYFQGHPVTMVIHHLLMYTVFGLTATVKILRHFKFTVPPLSEYVMFLIANAATAFLLSNHVSGRTMVDVKMHIILLYLDMVQILCVGIEIIFNRSVMATIGRSLVCVAQGTWLWVMAVVIHPLFFMHKFDLDNRMLFQIAPSLAIVTVVFSVTVVYMINVIAYKKVENMNSVTVNYIVAVTHSRRSALGAKTEVESPLITESDNDI